MLRIIIHGLTLFVKLFFLVWAFVVVNFLQQHGVDINQGVVTTAWICLLACVVVQGILLFDRGGALGFVAFITLLVGWFLFLAGVASLFLMKIQVPFDANGRIDLVGSDEVFSQTFSFASCTMFYLPAVWAVIALYGVVLAVQIPFIVWSWRRMRARRQRRLGRA
jgi:hypothetical protein